MGCHRPADHPPAAGIEDEGQVDEALSGADVGYVRYPQPVGLLCGEVPPDQVRGGLLKRYSVGGPHPPTAQTAPKLRPAHEPGDPLPAATDADGSELGMHPGSSVGGAAVAVDRLYLLREHRVEAGSLG